jgi:hypothetical protein
MGSNNTCDLMYFVDTVVLPSADASHRLTETPAEEMNLFLHISKGPVAP